MKYFLLVATALLCCFPALYSQSETVYYVDSKASEGGDGTSWQNAFNTLQQALEVAQDPAEIWVAAGIYYPESVYDLGEGDFRLRHFRMKNGVAVYGGFSGEETALEERDWKENRTVLSGRIPEEGHCYHIFYHVGRSLDETAILDGFTITGGQAEASGGEGLHYLGGGMLNAPEITFSGDPSDLDNLDYTEGTGSSPTVKNCLFQGNRAEKGGAMANLLEGGGLIMQCRFDGNRAAEGGGIFNALGADPFIANSFIENNNGVESERIFPGAVGYGTQRGGAYESSAEPVILVVDTLHPGTFSTGSNRGTFMWAVTRNYPRIVVFEVSGIIDFSATSWRVQIEEPYLNVYGQTAPGKGITIKGAIFWIQSHDMLFQHMRFKPGDHDHGRDPDGIDALTFYHGGENVVFDHCSFSWSVDELVGTKASNQNLTFSNCIFSEPLDKSWHMKEETLLAERHSYGCLMYAGNLTFYRNLFAYSYGRNPLIRQAGNHVINNYNYCSLWSGTMVENIGYDIHAAIISNHVDNIPFDGELKSSGDYHTYIVNHLTSGSRIYVEDNICRQKQLNPGQDEWSYVINRNRATQATTPTIALEEFDILPSGSVKEYVLNNAGAFPWQRNLSDQSVITKIRENVQGELRHSAYDYPATARPIVGTATTGDFSDGYDWSADPQDLVLSYNEEPGGDIIGPVTLTLDASCATVVDVVNHLNSNLPDALEAVRCGSPGFPGYNVFVRTNHSGDGAFLEIHDSGTAHTQMGIPARQFNGASYVGYDDESASHELELPNDPHSDVNENGFTRLQEWIYAMYETNGRKGGGILNYKSDPVTVNCVFSGNYAIDAGAGMYNEHANPTVINCSFTKNVSLNGAGGMGNSFSAPILINTILYGNLSDIAGYGEIRNEEGIPEFFYCNVQGSGGSNGWNSVLGSDGGGNIDQDPLFLGVGDHPWMPDYGSACIDAGTNEPFEENGVAQQITTDIRGAGWDRLLPEDGESEEKIVDMGAYEVNAETPPVGIERTVPRDYQDKPEIMVYPNPVRDVFFVKYRIQHASSAPAYSYRLTDMTGRPLISGSLKDDLTRIDVEGVPEGIYLFTILEDQKIIKVHKLAVQ